MPLGADGRVMSLPRAESTARVPAARPAATYRVQLNAGFDLDAAAALTSYVAALGISHLYCSPYMQAAPGSEHGYDVADPTRVNDELGGEGAHARLSAALAEHGLGQLLDIVPNHTAIVRENPWWWDVLEDRKSTRLNSSHVKISYA